MVPRLSDGEVRTWVFAVAEALPCYDRLFALLSAEERQRAMRYLSAQARHEFVVGRGSLRLLLGRALPCEPRGIYFTVGSSGKLHTAGMDFNLSHAHGLIAVALSAAGPVGIDVEQEAREVEVLDVAEAVFAAEELALLRGAVSLEEQRRLFFAMWTAYEAKAKCLGLGLSQLDEVRRQSSGLCVTRLTLPAGYQGAVCLCRPNLAVQQAVLSKASIEWLLNCR